MIGWVLFLVLLAWSGAVGVLAGIGASAARGRFPEPVQLALAVLLLFGGALAFSGHVLPNRYLLAGVLGFAAAVLLEFQLDAATRESVGPAGDGAGAPPSPDRFEEGN